MSGEKFEENEAEAGAEGAGGVEEPESGGGPFLEVAADPADEAVREEEGEIISQRTQRKIWILQFVFAQPILL
jgi:hypothetical protein